MAELESEVAKGRDAATHKIKLQEVNKRLDDVVYKKTVCILACNSRDAKKKKDDDIYRLDSTLNLFSVGRKEN